MICALTGDLFNHNRVFVSNYIIENLCISISNIIVHFQLDEQYQLLKS